MAVGGRHDVERRTPDVVDSVHGDCDARCSPFFQRRALFDGTRGGVQLALPAAVAARANGVAALSARLMQEQPQDVKALLEENISLVAVKDSGRLKGELSWDFWKE